jgi:predicted nucleic acid-binding protein
MGKFLIDTSAAIKYLNETFPQEALVLMDQIVDKQCAISFITKIELLVWDSATTTDFETLKIFVENSTIYYINESIINLAIKLRRSTKIKLPDAVIAATSINYNLVLLSDNNKDFDKAKPFGLINPKLNPSSLKGLN